MFSTEEMVGAATVPSQGLSTILEIVTLLLAVRKYNHKSYSRFITDSRNISGFSVMDDASLAFPIIITGFKNAFIVICYENPEPSRRCVRVTYGFNGA